MISAATSIVIHAIFFSNVYRSIGVCAWYSHEWSALDSKTKEQSAHFLAIKVIFSFFLNTVVSFSLSCPFFFPSITMRRISLPPSPVDAFLNTTTIECTRFYFDDSARSSDVKQHPSFLQRSTSDLSRHLMEDGLAPYRPGSISSSTSNSSVAAALTDIKQHHPKTHHIQLVEGSARTWTCLDSVLAENVRVMQTAASWKRQL